HHAVLAAGGQTMSIRMESHIPDLSRMTGQRLQFLPRASIPQLDGLVRARGGQPRIVGAEGDAGDPVLVPRERKLLSTCRHVPYFDGVIRAAGGEMFAIVTECKAQHLM